MKNVDAELVGAELQDNGIDAGPHLLAAVIPRGVTLTQKEARSMLDLRRTAEIPRNMPASDNEKGWLTHF